MKKLFFPIIFIVGLAATDTAKAEKTTTTVSVPGSASSVTTVEYPGGGSRVFIDCDASAFTCYTQTTTTEIGAQLSYGDKVEISVTAADGDVFYIVGGYIDITVDQADDGSTQHEIILSREWNE